MEYGISLSDKLFPLIDVAFYGQYTDESWFRFDKLYPFDSGVRQIIVDSIKFVDESKDIGRDVSYVSWGIDSKVFVYNPLTNEVGHVGNVLFLDFDDGIELISVMRKIAYLQRDGLIHSNPDIVKTEHGFHVYVYEMFDFLSIRNILKKDYIYLSICPKFFKSTMYLKSSVLRLSYYKKGRESRLELIELGNYVGDIGLLYRNFVRGRFDENV